MAAEGVAQLAIVQVAVVVVAIVVPLLAHRWVAAGGVAQLAVRGPGSRAEVMYVCVEGGSVGCDIGRDRVRPVPLLMFSTSISRL